MTISRRTLCAVSLTGAVAAPAYAAFFSEEYPKLRLGTNLEDMYKNLLEKGNGISKHPKDSPLPKVLIITDTMCPWCSKLFLESEPLTDEINFIWYPVCVLGDPSVTQAAYILQSENPWETLKEQESTFKNETKGIDTTGKEIKPDFRKKIWDNAKIFRRAGGTVVPFGVYKNSDGKFIPFFESFAKLDDLK